MTRALAFATRLVNPCSNCGAHPSRKVSEWQVVKAGGLTAWWVPYECRECGIQWKVERLSGRKEQEASGVGSHRV